MSHNFWRFASTLEKGFPLEIIVHLLLMDILSIVVRYVMKS